MRYGAFIVVKARLLVCVIALILSFTFACAQSFEGIWQGNVTYNGTEMRVELRLERRGAEWHATASLPDVLPKSIDIDQIEQTDQRLILRAASFELTLTYIEGADRLEGALRAENTPETIPILLYRKGNE